MKQTFKATFGDIKVGKKTTIAIEIKGDLSDEQKLALLEFAQSDGFIQLASAQRDIDDYAPVKPTHVGIAYTLKGAEVQVNSEQLVIDDVIGDGWESENKELTPEMAQQVGNKKPNWLEQEELIAEQEEKLKKPEPEYVDEENNWGKDEAEAEDELSDELE